LRSIPEFPLLEHLKSWSDILLNSGGHDFAAGMSLKEGNIEEFKKRFIQVANEKLSSNDVMPKLFLDAEISLHDLTFDFMESNRLLEPYGNENPPPILYATVKQTWAPKIVGKQHLKIFVEQGDKSFEAFGYNKAHLFPKLRNKENLIKIAFTPQINNFQGQSIQLLVREVKIV
jgi:single-stranded-DNA-specific exonuclease